MFHTIYDEKQRLWSGIDYPQIYNASESLGHSILDALTTHSKRLAQISDDSGIRLSFDEIRSRSIRAAQNLRARGYKKGQVFGFIAANSHHVAPIVFASLYLGCPINTMDPSFGKIGIKNMLSTTKPSLMFCDIGIYNSLKECLNELGNDAEIFTFGGQIGNSEPVENLFEENGDENDFVPTNVDGQKDVAFILCSSGTTGASKGVCLSHVALSKSLTRYTTIHSDHVILCYSSLYWISGAKLLIDGTLCGATRVITTRPPTMATFLQTIEKHRVTYVLNGVLQTIALAKSDLIKTADLSSVQCFVTGGGRISQVVRDQINKYLPNGKLHIMYGMSETAGTCASDFPIPHGHDSVGQLISGVHVKLTDENGNRCGVGVSGEVCIKGSYPYLGYYNNQAANDELFDEEGFLRSGDIGYFDEKGYLYIVDRKKDMFKYRIFKISPSYVEALLLQSPLIKSVCVVGIPDEIDGELIAACIVPTEGVEIDEKIVLSMIDDSVADHYKLRGGVYFVDSLPTTPSGKVLRRKVKEILIKKYYEKQSTH